MKNYFLTSYKKRLESIPAPGGNGCHSAILGVANYGVMAGLTPEQIYSDIRRAIPHGRRNVPDREIQSAILKAFSDQKKTIRLPNGEFHNRYTP